MPSSPFGSVDEVRAAQERLRRFNEWDERHPEPALDADELRELFERGLFEVVLRARALERAVQAR